MRKVWTEVELCIVIGKTASNVDENQADKYIFGFTIGNDVTTSNIIDRDHHLARSKAWDTICPLGPWIETELITDDLRIPKNKEVIQTFANHYDIPWQYVNREINRYKSGDFESFRSQTFPFLF